MPAAMAMASQCPPPALAAWPFSARPETDLDPGPAPQMLTLDSASGCSRGCNCIMQGGPKAHLPGLLFDVARLEGFSFWLRWRRGLRDFCDLMGSIQRECHLHHIWASGLLLSHKAQSLLIGQYMSVELRFLSKAFTGIPHLVALPAAWPAPSSMPSFHEEARLWCSLWADPPQAHLPSATHTSAFHARRSHVLARIQSIGNSAPYCECVFAPQIFSKLVCC